MPRLITHSALITGEQSAKEYCFHRAVLSVIVVQSVARWNVSSYIKVTKISQLKLEILRESHYLCFMRRNMYGRLTVAIAAGWLLLCTDVCYLFINAAAESGPAVRNVCSNATLLNHYWLLIINLIQEHSNCKLWGIFVHSIISFVTHRLVCNYFNV